MSKPRDHRAVMAQRQPTAADDPDFFPTAPWAGRWLAGFIQRYLDPCAASAWECACGAGSLAQGLRLGFPVVWESDAYAYDGNRIHDFLGDAPPPFDAEWIITNPPFGDRPEGFIRQAYRLAGHGVAMLGRVGLLESVGRYSLLYRDCPLTIFAPFSERLPLVKGRWDPDASSAAFYAWFIWLKRRPGVDPRRFMARIGADYFPATVPIPPGTEARLTHPSDAARFGVVERGAA